MPLFTEASAWGTRFEVPHLSIPLHIGIPSDLWGMGTPFVASDSLFFWGGYFLYAYEEKSGIKFV
jgi:hypothetical protein